MLRRLSHILQDVLWLRCGMTPRVIVIGPQVQASVRGNRGVFRQVVRVCAPDSWHEHALGVFVLNEVFIEGDPEHILEGLCNDQEWLNYVAGRLEDGSVADQLFKDWGERNRWLNALDAGVAVAYCGVDEEP